MSKFFRGAALAACIGLAAFNTASPASADPDSGSNISMQRAMLIANDFGVVGVHQVQFSDGRWQIEGRDPRGREVRMNIDAATGAVLRVERDD